MQSPVETLLAQVGHEDPRMMLMLNALRQATERSGAVSELETLRARVESLARVGASLRQRLADVAAALGACPRCLGEVPGCPACGGDGVPGMRRPDPDAFARYVIPAVRRVRAQGTHTPLPTAAQPEVSDALRR
jgi:hypothetical protein